MHRQVKLSGVQLSDLLLRLSHQTKNVFVLSSYSDNGWGKVLAWRPVAMLSCQSFQADGARKKLSQFTAEQQKLKRLVIGYASYDFGCLLHGVALPAEDDLNMPLALAASFDNWFTFDASAAYIHSSDPGFVREVKQLLKQPVRQLATSPYKSVLKPAQSRHWYHEAYQKIENYIRAGDAYQVNLAQRLEATTQTAGQDIFCLLSEASQTDFQAYIKAEGIEVISLSPERFIQVTGQRIKTSPIKGTRPRGLTPAQDDEQRQDLATSHKDRAELNMITDLMRNDLGVICKIGSVKIEQERLINAYPTLWHAHSTITGSLRPEISPITALISMLPSGSITGCPKKRAMEIINELEPQRRGIYTGSIFSIDPSGNLDSSVAIRTMVKKASRLYLCAGGGIVYDSNEADEYRESTDKAAAFRIR